MATKTRKKKSVIRPTQKRWWNYRVAVRGEYYSIYEVYYTDGMPARITESPVCPGGDTLEELKRDLKSFQAALKRPVLKYEDF